jgi:parvulin-like peptidyl-prolyl isomerase
MLRSAAFAVLGVACIAPAAQSAYLDRVVASVNNEVITLSDLRSAVTFNRSGGSRQEGRQLAAETLDGLVNRKLLLQEALRLRFAEVSDAEVRAEGERFQRGFASDDAYREFLKRADLAESRLLLMLRERLVVERFVQRKIEMYARVSREDVQAYYDEHRTEFAGRRFSEVQAEISSLLSGQMAAQQLDAYLAELRGRAEIRINSLEGQDGF